MDFWYIKQKYQLSLLKWNSSLVIYS